MWTQGQRCRKHRTPARAGDEHTAATPKVICMHMHRLDIPPGGGHVLAVARTQLGSLSPSDVIQPSPGTDQRRDRVVRQPQNTPTLIDQALNTLHYSPHGGKLKYN